MQQRIVSPRNHLFWPVPIRRVPSIKYYVKFDESIQYDLKSVDQHDWNKLCGLNCDIWNKRAEMAMIGFRWYQEQLQLAPYFHIKSRGKDRILPKDWLVLPINRWILIKVAILPDRYELEIAGKVFKEAHKHQRIKGWETPTWFGGTKSAPQEIRITFKNA